MKSNNITQKLVIYVIAVSSSFAVSMADLQETYITRKEIIQHLEPKISIQLQYKDTTEEETEQILDNLELDKWASEVLPEKFELSQASHKDRILNSYNYIIEYNDPEYIELGIKLKLMNVGLRCYASASTPVIKQVDKQNIEDAIKSISVGIKDSIYRHLGTQIPKNKIEEIVEKLLVGGTLSRIDEPWVTAFKKPLEKEEVDRLIAVFDERLARTKDRAIERIKDIEEMIELEEEQRAEILSKLERQLLTEITLPLITTLSNQTYNEDYELNAEDYSPEYSKIQNSYRELGNELRTEARIKFREKQTINTSFAPLFSEVENTIDSGISNSEIIINNDLINEKQYYFIPKIDKNLITSKPCIFDFVSGTLVAMDNNNTVLDSNDVNNYLVQKNTGDIAWSNALITLRGAEVLHVRHKSNAPLILKDEGKWIGTYGLPETIELPYSLIIKTRKEVYYFVDIHEIKPDGIRITYRNINKNEVEQYISPDE